MIVNIRQNGVRDFSQRYCDTYGWLIQGDKRRFIYVESITENKIYFNEGNDVEYFVYTDSNTTFEFIPVDRGWFNTNTGDALFLYRCPARQWKRGISNNNTAIISYRNLLLEVNYSTLSSVFNDDFEKNNYPKEFKTGALSKHFCFDPYNRLLLYTNHVGDVVDNTIIVSNKLFLQEITDLVNRNEWDVKVEYNF